MIKEICPVIYTSVFYNIGTVCLYLGEDIELVAIDPHKDEIELILLRILEQDLGD